jgi:hypothetical protein
MLDLPLPSSGKMGDWAKGDEECLCQVLLQASGLVLSIPKVRDRQIG